MRIVLDTNVLIAAFIARGVCNEVFEHCARRHTLVTSDFVLGEFRRTLVEKFKRAPEAADLATTLTVADGSRQTFQTGFAGLPR